MIEGVFFRVFFFFFILTAFIARRRWLEHACLCTLSTSFMYRHTDTHPGYAVKKLVQSSIIAL